MDDLDFISDVQLRKTLEDSIEYIYALYEQSKGAEQKPLYIEETHRVIVLYVVAAIEAVLLFFYKERKEKMEFCEYKYIMTLSDKYRHKDKEEFPVVVAVQEKVEKTDYQIGLHDLVIFFLKKKLIQKKTANRILEINDIRNTFHFSKARTKACDIEKVEEALSLLVHTLERAPEALKTT